MEIHAQVTTAVKKSITFLILFFFLFDQFSAVEVAGMVTQTEMEERIRVSLEPESCDVVVLSEEDRKYGVVIVSRKFNDVPLVKRHRMVNDLFKDELLSGEIHALTITAKPLP
ncbi:hypothetical protein, conserved [Trypanosoma brucei brucei TREU927]|uniref:BolA-like protein n=2 Tax=Trypanosoma brucei TaxID=5691 RepID=Q38CL2_TRYB2|nr:hypothetical protein, conserved [Trypanosoma brucei brucei TREU927]EAN77458.1 hypothetical protein, conserved [Trypanosoma brucei brucei TREU927]